MTPLQFKTAGGEGLDILCLGAHCDDIEIGCGGTLLKLIAEYPVRHLKWVVFASNAERKPEALGSAEAFLEGVAQPEIRILDYRDAFLPSFAAEIKEHFESIKSSFNPNLVFTHYREDRHQDHSDHVEEQAELIDLDIGTRQKTGEERRQDDGDQR